MTRRLLALAGKAGSGKDTVADIIGLQHEGHVITCGFADRLKDGLYAMLGVRMWELDRAQKEAPIPHLRELGNISPRHLAQTLGTEWGRSIHPNLWVHMMEQDMATHHAEVTIITDCRFPNEVKWVKSQGGTVWWVGRDGIAPVRAHASEDSIGPMDCDRTIANLGTIEDLERTVVRAWAELTREVEA